MDGVPDADAGEDKDSSAEYFCRQQRVCDRTLL